MKYPPHVLDIGCGTGRVLDLGLATSERYPGVDLSQAMLNVLVRKHPRAAAMYPIDVHAALLARKFTPGQLNWVFVDGAVEVLATERAQVEHIARRRSHCRQRPRDGPQCARSIHSTHLGWLRIMSDLTDLAASVGFCR